MVEYINGKRVIEGYKEGARVYNSSAISCTAAEETKLTFDSERYDTDSIHDVGSNTDRLTCQTAGKYLITGQVAFATGAGDCTMLIYLNNTTIIGFKKFIGTTSTDGIAVNTPYRLSVSDYVDVRVVHGTNTVDVLAGANYSPEFAMHRIG